ncbi:MAG: winged helix-turn-helix domain-containing protein [Lachnospiraceae bacterium]|nr:winged helix-turn-helix domain-containing protein [Lachnospiraceae bacterium]
MSDTSNVTYDVTYGKKEALNITEQAVLAVLKQDSEISRGEIAERVSKTVRTVQRALAGPSVNTFLTRLMVYDIKDRSRVLSHIGGG